jgi:hypothetical protein
VVYRVILKGTDGEVFVLLFDRLCKLYAYFICYLLIIHYTEFLELKYAASLKWHISEVTHKELNQTV